MKSLNVMKLDAKAGLIFAGLAAALLAGATGARALETAFAYQARLVDGPRAAEGSHDFLFRLYDAAENGAEIGQAAVRDGVEVSGGLFEVELDFGHDLFTGEPCYLEIAVRPEGSGGAYTVLSPRQAFIPVPGAWKYPYAVYAAEARSSALDSAASVIAVGLGRADGEGVSPLDAHGVGAGAASILHQGGANAANATYSSVGGGFTNTINTTASHGTISGGRENDLAASAEYSAVGGGRENKVASASTYCVIGGGGYNDVAGSAPGCVIAGGYVNDILADANYSAVGGGYDNDIGAGAECGVISGGGENDISNSVDYATIGGGWLNMAGGIAATVGGGRFNEASGTYATVPGGRKNRAVNYSLAAGYRAKAAHRGSFVWADVTEANLKTTANDEFLARAKGGFRFYTDGAMTTGARLNSGSGSWTSLSDRDSKENLRPVDGRRILERLVETPIRTWNYKAQDDSVRHMGAMAQDLRAAFGLGMDEKTIATVDADGISMAAIQGLYGLVKEKEAEIESLKERLTRLEKGLGAR
jgi:hypothetical protein